MWSKNDQPGILNVMRKCIISETNNNYSPSLAKVKSICHIYRSGSGASSPSCNLPPYDQASKNHNLNENYRSSDGSRRSNGFRILKFGDPSLDKATEEKVDQEPNKAYSSKKQNTLEDTELRDENILGKII